MYMSTFRQTNVLGKSKTQILHRTQNDMVESSDSEI